MNPTRCSFVLALALLPVLAGCGGDGGTGPGPAGAVKLAFATQPSGRWVGQPISPAVRVVAQDAGGHTATGATDSITLAVTAGTGAAGARLVGTATVRAAAGVATFTDVRVDVAAAGYTLTASAAGLASAVSASFDVTGFASVSAGQGHSCGVTTAREAFCWGLNDEGQVGVPSSSIRFAVPAQVFGALTFTAVAAGTRSTCGLTTAGAGYCWGYATDGALGNGQAGPPSQASPVAVVGGLSFASVSVGYSSACGVVSGGAAWCWGIAPDGIGSDSVFGSTTPVPVSGGLLFKSVSVGGVHACGVTTGGAASCWGGNASGQLGDGSTTGSPTPVPVSGGLTFAAVSAGGSFSCGVTTTGAAYCWGAGPDGELGDGLADSSVTPVPVSGGLAFASVSSSGNHSCGVTTGGGAYCWGANAFGQLGNGSTTGSASPVPVSGGLTFATVSAGGFHSCGVTTAGSAYCWGAGGAGQLGDGNMTDASSPVPVSRP